MPLTANSTLVFDEDQAMILDVAREFCRKQSPVSAARAQLEAPAAYDEQIWQQMVELGWSGLALPESVGGAGLGLRHAVGVFEAMGRSLLTTPLMSSTLAGQLLLRSAGVGEAVERVLAAIASGAAVTVALLENEDWGDERLDCRLNEAGQLVGAKCFVPDALSAECFVVVAQRAGVPVLALVQADQLPPGAIQPHVLVDETRRAARVDFSAVDLAPEAIVSGPEVAAALRDFRLLGALLVAAEASGSAAASLDTTVAYLNTRKQFGRLIGSYQSLKHPCVDILLAIDSARSFVYHAASLLGDGALGRDAEIACRMAKAQAGEALVLASDRSVQFHGAMGFTYECDAQLYIRRAQWSQQQFGDALYHRKRLASLLLD